MPHLTRKGGLDKVRSGDLTLTVSNSRMEMNSSESTEPELDLHRLTVDEALPRIDQFLYEAYVAGIPSVRIVHGKGTGALRSAIRDWLPKHYLVKSFRPADKVEGGEGVTIVYVAD